MGKLQNLLATAKRRYVELSGIAKVIGVLSTIGGVATAGWQAYSTISDHFSRRAATAGYIRIADGQLADREYNAAWNANAKALDIEPKNATALAQQARIAMIWLEDARISSKTGAKTFSDIVDPLEDALDRRSIATKGVELATIEAHIGWARYLRSRDGVTGLRILGEFSDALSMDPTNMYAHVMRGFVTLWSNGSLADARKDFDAALSSDVDPSYRDSIILAALFLYERDEFQLAAIDYANQIRKTGRTIDPDLKRRLFLIYELGLRDHDYLVRLSRAIPFSEHIATIGWLMEGQTGDSQARRADVLKAYFTEMAGQRSEALALYRQVMATSAGSGSEVASFAQMGIRRLTDASTER